MSYDYATALYDPNLNRWLDKRATRAAAARNDRPGGRPAGVSKIDLNALLRAEFSPQVLARLNALGLAT